MRRNESLYLSGWMVELEFCNSCQKTLSKRDMFKVVEIA